MALLATENTPLRWPVTRNGALLEASQDLSTLRSDCVHIEGSVAVSDGVRVPYQG